VLFPIGNEKANPVDLGWLFHFHDRAFNRTFGKSHLPTSLSLQSFVVWGNGEKEKFAEG
jgi:hypothetical protein